MKYKQNEVISSPDGKLVFRKVTADNIREFDIVFLTSIHIGNEIINFPMVVRHTEIRIYSGVLKRVIIFSDKSEIVINCTDLLNVMSAFKFCL